MIKYFKKAFKITNENIILTTPLILFLFLLSIYLDVAKNAPESILSAVLLLSTTLFMLGAFFAGWFHMVKKAVDLDRKEFVIDEDKAKASFNLIKEIPAGIGEYFFPVVGTIILYFFLFVGLSFISYKIGAHFLGKIDLSPAELKMIINSVETKTLISSIPADKLAKLEIWYLLFLVVMTIHYFITMFLAPEVIIRTKNPIIAFGKSVAFIFRNFLPSVILFAYVNIISFLVSLVLNGILIMHFIPEIILSLISMLIYFYFIVYVIVLVFLYYDSKIREKDQNNCGSGTDSCGENEICNQDSLGE